MLVGFAWSRRRPNLYCFGFAVVGGRFFSWCGGCWWAFSSAAFLLGRRPGFPAKRFVAVAPVGMWATRGVVQVMWSAWMAVHMMACPQAARERVATRLAFFDGMSVFVTFCRYSWRMGCVGEVGR